MLSPQALLKGIVSRILPPPYADNQSLDVPLRLRRYGDVIDPVFTKHILADEGAFFTATMTPGQAALAYGLNASFSDTAAFIVVQNVDSAIGQGTGKRIYLDLLKFIYSVAPASSTAAWIATKIDNVNRTPSANLSAITPQNVNMDSILGSIAKVWFPSGGTLTVPAVGGAARLIEGNLNVRNTIPVVSDEVNVQFGSTDYGNAFLVAEAATVSKIIAHTAPVVIGPGQFALIYLWFPANATTAASFSDIHLQWWER